MGSHPNPEQLLQTFTAQLPIYLLSEWHPVTHRNTRLVTHDADFAWDAACRLRKDMQQYYDDVVIRVEVWIDGRKARYIVTHGDTDWKWRDCT